MSLSKVAGLNWLNRKIAPIWSQQISFLNDYEATREAMLLQAPKTGRKISAELTKRCRGESSNTPRYVSS